MRMIWSQSVVPDTVIPNEPRYSELIAAILSQCQLFLLVQRCSSPADNVRTLAPVTSICPSSDITDASGAVDGTIRKQQSVTDK